MKNKDITLAELDTDLYSMFYEKSKHSTPFHSLDFLISITNSREDLKLYFSVIYNNSTIYAVMPYFKSLRIPFTMLSLPYGCYGGYLYINDIVNEYLKTKNPFKLLTNFVSYQNNIYDKVGFEVNKLSTWVIRTDITYDILFQSLHTKTRNQIRKSLKENIIVSDIKNKEELEEVKKIYQELVRKHDIYKPYNNVLFDNLFDKSLMSENIIFKLAKKDKQIISYSVFLKNKNSIFYWLNASKHEYLKFNGTNAILNSILKYACESSCQEFNMGAVPNGNYGLQHFKSRWNAEEKEYKNYSSKLYVLLRKIK
jgi:hypothetical protein